jgi:hypothetical protein
MAKSLGEYVIEKSSSTDIQNITWTKKNPKNTEKSKKKKYKTTSASNIIYAQKTKKVSSPAAKVFKIEVVDTEKSKKKKSDKRHQNSSASKCKIKPEFKRPAR